jgi:inosose dehydratase
VGGSLDDRLAVGPISWGICEVPGWGAQLPPERVLGEIRSLGIRAVEAGPIGYLGEDAAAIRRRLEQHELSLVGGFVPVVVHDPAQLTGTLAAARSVAALYAAAGGQVLVSAPVVDLDWSPRIPLDTAGWRAVFDGLARIEEIAAQEALQHVVHPHVGTLVETADDVERVLAGSEVRLCLDTGHLTLGGFDPLALARDAPDRVGHVHLKEVRGEPMGELRAGRVTLLEATRRGVFAPLGEGEAHVAETVRALEQHSYAGWYVLEQDAAFADGQAPAPGSGPVEDARRSIRFLESLLDGRDTVVSSTGREVGRTTR